jgi:hypothetical protein
LTNELLKPPVYSYFPHVEVTTGIHPDAVWTSQELAGHFTLLSSPTPFGDQLAIERVNADLTLPHDAKKLPLRSKITSGCSLRE